MIHRMRILQCILLLLPIVGTGAIAGLERSAPAQGRGDKALTKMLFATASPTPNPLFMNIEIGAELGFFQQEGIDPEFLHTGSNAAVTTLLDQGKAQVGVGTPNFQVSYAAQGKSLPGICFYEYVYPLKWDIAVMPNSPVHNISQLKGRTLGIVGRGTADENVAKSFITLSGTDPAAVELVVVGQGTPGAVALQQGRIDAMLAWDTTLGQWDATRIAYRLLPRPKNLQPVGGFYLQATPGFLSQHRELAAGFARAVAKSTVFALANLRAASDAYLKLHPDAAGQGHSRAEAVDIVATIVGKRATHWVREGDHYLNPKMLLGQMRLEEWHNEITFAGEESKLNNPAQFFTNDLIQSANNFNRKAIVELAEKYRIQD